jgi:hypothetical protein
VDDLMSRGGALGEISAAVSVRAFAVALATYLRQRRQGDFALARELHNDLVTGDVAKARDLLGTVVHDPDRVEDGELPRVRDAYFTLLWCFERIYAGRVAIADGWYWRNRPLDFIDCLAGWHVDYWVTNLDVAKNWLEERLGTEIKDGRSRSGLLALHAAIRPECRAGAAG